MKRILKTIITILVAVSIFMPNPYVYGESNVRTAKITDFAGDADIMKSGSEKVLDAKKGMKLTHGDRIITGKDSWVMLDVDGDKELKVGAKTYVSLEELTYDEGEKTGIKLFKGEIWTNIKKKLGKDDEFEVKTPNAIMGARGTKFLVSYTNAASDAGTGTNENKSKLTVIEGTVQAVATASVKVKDENGNLVEKQLTIAVSVEEGEDVELIKEKIQSELQKIADEIQSMDSGGEVALDQIKQVIQSKITNEEMEAMNVKELDFKELDAFSIETIIEDMNNSQQTEETQQLRDNLKNILDTVKEKEKQEEQQQEKEINQVVSDSKIVYGGVVTGGSGGSSSSTPPSTVYPASVSFDQSQQITMYVEDSLQLTATVLPANATNKSLIWQTSDPSVATVENGFITAVGQGSTTITAVTVLGNVTAACEVVVQINEGNEGNEHTFMLDSARTIDSDCDGRIDRIRVGFSQAVESIDLSKISIMAENNVSIGAITSAAVNSDFPTIVDIFVEEEDQGLQLNYNTALKAKITIPSDAVVSSSGEAFSEVSGYAISDYAGPVLLGWKMDFDSSDKSIQLKFSDMYHHIDTAMIFITDQTDTTSAAINSEVTSTSAGIDGSFTADIEFSSPDVVASIIDLHHGNNQYFLKLGTGAFMDEFGNTGVLFQNEYKLECSSYTVDTTNPTVSAITMDDGDLLISFNEFLNEAYLDVWSEYVEFGNHEILDGNKQVKIEISSETLQCEDSINISVEDLQGNLIEIVCCYNQGSGTWEVTGGC